MLSIPWIPRPSAGSEAAAPALGPVSRRLVCPSSRQRRACPPEAPRLLLPGRPASPLRSQLRPRPCAWPGGAAGLLWAAPPTAPAAGASLSPGALLPASWKAWGAEERTGKGGGVSPAGLPAAAPELRGGPRGRGPAGTPHPTRARDLPGDKEERGPFKNRARHPFSPPRRAIAGEQWGTDGGGQQGGGGGPAAAPRGRPAGRAGPRADSRRLPPAKPPPQLPGRAPPAARDAGCAGCAGLRGAAGAAQAPRGSRPGSGAAGAGWSRLPPWGERPSPNPASQRRVGPQEPGVGSPGSALSPPRLCLSSASRSRFGTAASRAGGSRGPASAPSPPAPARAGSPGLPRADRLRRRRTDA